MFKATNTSQIISGNTEVNKNNYSEITVKNLGTSSISINDNIPIEPGESYNWQCLPGTVIDQSTSVRFTTPGTKKALLILVYFK